MRGYIIKLLSYENGKANEDRLLNERVYADKEEAFLDAVQMAEEEIAFLEKENPTVTYDIPDNASFSNGQQVMITEKFRFQKKAKKLFAYCISAV